MKCMKKAKNKVCRERQCNKIVAKSRGCDVITPLTRPKQLRRSCVPVEKDVE